MSIKVIEVGLNLFDRTYIGGTLNDNNSTLDKIELDLNGVRGDRHYGQGRAADVRDHVFPKGQHVFNTRQISVTTVEEHAQIAESLSIPNAAVTGSTLFSNIVLRGLPNFTQLLDKPGMFLLKFSRQAAILLMSVNNPCQIAAESVMKSPHLNDEEAIVRVRREFVTVASGKRGLMAIVACPGSIKVGDTVELVEWK